MIFLLQYDLPLFILSLLSVCKSSPLHSVISLNCTPPSPNDIFDNKSIQVVVDRLTYGVTKTRFITSTFNNAPNRLIITMQCRPNLSPTTCRHCAQIAKETIFNLCPNSVAVRAWLDGCYLQYCYHQNYTAFSHACVDTNNYYSCSNKSKVTDRVQFESALQTLLLRLRADIKTVSHFTTGKIQYSNRSEVYALADCLQNVSLKDCEVCVRRGIENISKRCGGKGGGTVVAGYCVVRYEGYEFFSTVDPGGYLDVNKNGSGTVSWIRENNENNGGGKTFKLKVAAIWSIGMACFVMIVLSAWLLRRSIINTAKVSTVGGNGK